jgi:hypothetical protein
VLPKKTNYSSWLSLILGSIWSNEAIKCWWFCEWISKSSMYTVTFEILSINFSISLWKLAGHPSSPIGIINHPYCQRPGNVKAIFGTEFECRGICQNPDLRSSVKKIVDLARSMSPMHSWICLCTGAKLHEYWLQMDTNKVALGQKYMLCCTQQILYWKGKDLPTCV